MSNPHYGGFASAGFVYRHQSALTNAYQTFALTRDTTNAERSVEMPSTCFFTLVCFELDTIAGGSTQVQFYLCRDAAGDRPISPLGQINIQVGRTTATRGSAVMLLDLLPWHNQRVAAVDVAETVHLTMRLNAGTANSNTYLYWRG